jgi:hypothetical protein
MHCSVIIKAFLFSKALATYQARKGPLLISHMPGRVLGKKITSRKCLTALRAPIDLHSRITMIIERCFSVVNGFERSPVLLQE